MADRSYILEATGSAVRLEGRLEGRPEESRGARPSTRSVPRANPRHFFLDFFVQLFAYREFLKQSIARDLKTKYKRSFLGYLWTVLHPLGMMAVIATVFSHIMKVPIKDYAIFLFAGLLPWNYFSSTVMTSLGNIRANARLFGQVAVPKYIFIVSIAGSNLVNFLLAVIPLLIILVASGMTLRPTVLALPIVLFPLVCVTLALSLILAVSNVFFDDTHHLAEVALQALYFLCPVLYSRSVLPQDLVYYLSKSPLFRQIEFIRGLFYDGTLPEPQAFAINCGISLALLFVGLWVFNRAQNKFLYVV